jgi:hypothetical protein
MSQPNGRYLAKCLAEIREDRGWGRPGRRSRRLTPQSLVLQRHLSTSSRRAVDLRIGGLSTSECQATEPSHWHLVGEPVEPELAELAA